MSSLFLGHVGNEGNWVMVFLFHKNDLILLYCSNKYNKTTVPYCFYLQVFYLVVSFDKFVIQNIQMYKDIGFHSKYILCWCVSFLVVVHKACSSWHEAMNLLRDTPRLAVCWRYHEVWRLDHKVIFFLSFLMVAYECS